MACTRGPATTLPVVYDVVGLGDIASVRQVLEIATIDALGLDNSLARSQVLPGAVSIATTRVSYFSRWRRTDAAHKLATTWRTFSSPR